MKPRTAGALTARVSEIFASIQGEGLVIGKPCVFVRFARCNLACPLCDTKYSWSGGKEMHVDELKREVESHGLKAITYTGGEPLLQPEVLEELARAMRAGGYYQIVETNASIVPWNVERLAGLIDAWSLSPKLPSMNPAYRLEWYRRLLDRLVQYASPRALIYVKFVVGELSELDMVMREYDSYISRHLDEDRVVLQPLDGSGITYNMLAGEVLRRKMGFRVLPQLHKLVGLK